MTFDIILAGVGGQGGLSVSVLVARAASAAGLQVKQSEVHGMSQRGGEVVAHLRLSDREIMSPTIPRGRADLILAFEPLEALRYLPWLSKDKGAIVSATSPIKNITDYPDTAAILAEIAKLPRSRVLDADAIAKESGSAKSANVALLGAAADLLPIGRGALEKEISEFFARKGEAVVDANLKAFREGMSHGSR